MVAVPHCYTQGSLLAVLEGHSSHLTVVVVASPALAEHTEEPVHFAFGRQLRSHRVSAVVEEGHHYAAAARTNPKVVWS